MANIFQRLAMNRFNTLAPTGIQDKDREKEIRNCDGVFEVRCGVERFVKGDDLAKK